MDEQLQMPLPEGTILHGSWRVIAVLTAEENSFLYLGADEADGSTVTIREYCPAFCTREGTAVLCDEDGAAGADGKAFREDARQFLRSSAIYREHIPLLLPELDSFSENNTSYTVSRPLPEGRLFSAVPQITAAYVQSLGIRLCECLAALHKAGYGAVIREDALRFGEKGSLYLVPDCLYEKPEPAEDVHILSAFLKSLLPPDAEDTPAVTVREALRFSYADANILRSALIGNAPRRTRKPVGLLLLPLCAVCLAASILSVQQIKKANEPLSDGLETGHITPEVISVWLPLAETADEKTTAAMYERLAAGFERQNPGCGVNIRIYADNSFEEALTMDGIEPPVVYMDTLAPPVLENAADLSSMTEALNDVYAADMTAFGNVIPLGCSVPVLYGSLHRDDLPEAVTPDTLPDGILFDESAQAFLDVYEPDAKTEETFPADSTLPILGSSDCLSVLSADSTRAGDVCLCPVTVDGKVPLQYELYCTVNAKCPPNSQRVGMLWLQYLLTEEAQNILFVEHYGTLPLHTSALQAAEALHSELEPLKEVTFDSTALQTRR